MGKQNESLYDLPTVNERPHRDAKTGRFLQGHKAGGRPSDLATNWRKTGSPICIEAGNSTARALEVKLASEFKEMFVAKNKQLKELYPKLIDVSTMKGPDREGRDLLARIATALKDVTAQQAPDTDWLIRVDGHADKQPTPAGGRYPSNWDLSAARAVTVVRSLVSNGIPAKRVAAETFGESQPLDPADTPAAYAKNRGIEIRLTEQ